VALYLSDDATLDPGDTLLTAKPVGLAALLKAFGGGKPVKIKAKVPAGTDLSGKFLIVVEDDGDLVEESDEMNNTAALGPLP
jgi:hypothetical protein